MQATCTTDGKEQTTCTACGTVLKTRTCKKTGCHYQDTQIIGIKPHTNITITIPATCTTDGKEQLKCSACGTVSNTKIIQKTGHDFENWRITKAATCTATGIRTRTCKKTGCHHEEKQTIEKKPHSYVVIETKPTCMSYGRKDTKCSDCGYVAESEVVEKLQHDYDNGIITKQPTCTATGTKLKTCKNYGCHNQLTEEVPLKPHSFKYRLSLNSDGLEEEYCENCGFKSGKTKKHTGWLKSDNSLYYYDLDGKKITSSTKLIGSNIYYFGVDGKLYTGWKKLSNGLGNSSYYFSNSGGISDDGPIGSYGAMCTGWHEIGTKIYYFNDGGEMLTGKQKIGDNWYYFYDTGIMHIGWLNLDNKYYYYDSNGIMLTGLHKIDDETYYFDSNGVKISNRDIMINGVYYHFDENGRWTDYSGAYKVTEDMTLPYKMVGGYDSNLQSGESVPTQISVEVNGTFVDNLTIPGGTVITLNSYGIVTSYTGTRLIVNGIDILANADFHKVIENSNKIIKISN